MKKLLIYIISIAVILIIVLQFIQPKKNSDESLETHIFSSEQIPENVKSIIQSSCLDCHSNKTVYLWFDRVSPASWMVNRHIIHAKKELNFSEWDEMDAFDKYGAFQDIQKEVEKKHMPLKSYTMMHKKARLSDAERKELVDWCKKRMNEINEELK